MSAHLMLQMQPLYSISLLRVLVIARIARILQNNEVELALVTHLTTTFTLKTLLVLRCFT